MFFGSGVHSLPRLDSTLQKSESTMINVLNSLVEFHQMDSLNFNSDNSPVGIDSFGNSEFQIDKGNRNYNVENLEDLT